MSWWRVRASWNAHPFFFSSRRRHTRFDCDWSSDVCSSDLAFWALLWARGATVVLVEYSVVTGVVWAALVGERVAVDLLLQKYAPRSLVAPRTLMVGARADCDELHLRSEERRVGKEGTSRRI